MVNAADIKSIREALGENQAEFAKHFGVSQTTIHRWETDGVPDRGPTRTVVEQFIASKKVPSGANGKAA